MSKINKLGKSTFVIAILSFLLVAVLAFGGTYAYFTATAKVDDGSVTTGMLRLSLTEGSGENTNTASLTLSQDKVVPNQQILNETINLEKGATNIPYYVRAKYSISITWADGNDADSLPDTAPAVGHVIDDKGTPEVDDDVVICGDDCGENHLAILNIAYDTEWVEATVAADETEEIVAGEGYYYFVGTGATNTAATDIAKVVKPTDADPTYDAQITINNWVGKGDCTYYQDATITIKLTFEAIQAEFIDHTTPVDEDSDEETPSTSTKARTVNALHTAWEAALKAEKKA